MYIKLVNVDSKACEILGLFERLTCFFGVGFNFLDILTAYVDHIAFRAIFARRFNFLHMISWTEASNLPY